MIQLPISLNFQSDRVTHKHVHQTFASLNNIANMLGVRTEAFSPSCIHMIANTPHRIKSYTCPYDTFLETLHNRSYGHVITVQDKDPSVAWLQDPMSMMSRWYHMFKNASSRWHVVDLNTSDVLHIYIDHKLMIAFPGSFFEMPPFYTKTFLLCTPRLKGNASLVNLMSSILKIAPFHTNQYVLVTSHLTHALETLFHFPRCQVPDNSVLSAEPSGT